MFLPTNLSKDLMRSIIVIYVLVTLAFALVHLIVEYTYSKHRFEQELVRISDTLKPSLQNAVWNMDKDQIRSIAQGITEIEMIYEIEVKDPDHKILAKVKNPYDAESTLFLDWKIPYTFPLYHQFKGRSIPIADVSLISYHSALLDHKQVEFWMIPLFALVKSTIIIILFIMVFSRNLGGPLEELTQKITEFSWHDKRKRRINLVMYKRNELSFLLTKFNDLLKRISDEEEKRIEQAEKHTRELERKVEERTKDLETLNEKLATLADTDALTGLNNRAKLDKDMKSLYEQFKRYKRPFSVILMDIDFFKKVNDTYGHDVGDKVLIDVANILKEYTRSTDIVGRWGGEEFLIICTETTLADAHKHAETLRKKISEHNFTPVKSVTGSFGVAEMKEGLELQKITKNADLALYHAKDHGRNKSVMYNA